MPKPQHRSPLHNQPTHYGWISIAIHWISFLLVLFLFVEGLYMVTLTYYDPLYNTLPYWHKWLGIVLGLITLFRILWITLSPKPTLLVTTTLEKIAAKSVHLALYTSLLLLFISGYLITTGNGEPLRLTDSFLGAQLKLPALVTLDPSLLVLCGTLHEWIAYGLMLLVSLHTAAALKHHCLDRDQTLTRMLKPTKSKEQSEE